MLDTYVYSEGGVAVAISKAASDLLKGFAGWVLHDFARCTSWPHIRCMCEHRLGHTCHEVSCRGVRSRQGCILHSTKSFEAQLVFANKDDVDDVDVDGK